jgi:hypothetical protein
MAASTLSTVAYIYKRLYSERAVGDLAKRGHPLFSMMRKEGGFTGTAFFYPIRYGNSQGISSLFAQAQANATASKGIQLQMSRKAKYATITLDGEAMAAAEGNKGAFLDLVRQETDGIIEEFGDTLAFDLYRDGYGLRGAIASGIAPGVDDVVTLSVADDARNFKVGMKVGAINAGLTTVRVGTTSIVAVDEDAGTVTLADSSAIASLANTDFLVRHGDVSPQGGGAFTSANCMEGLASHLPLTAPSLSDTFRGLATPGRGADPRRLAGVRVDDTATSIEENIGLVAVKISQVGKKADSAFVNPLKFWEVVRRLNAKVMYEDGGDKANMGFDSVAVHTPAGTVRLYADPDCPTNRGYVLNMSTWYLKHLKGLPHIIEDDGRPNLRSTSEDSIEARVRCWVNMVCTEPGSNGVFSI